MRRTMPAPDKLPALRIGATEFKARCLSLLDLVATRRDTIVVTKHGRPVARLVPFEEEPAPRAFGILAGTVWAADDLVAPTGERWNAG
jgi:prevent-host-death family protein